MIAEGLLDSIAEFRSASTAQALIEQAPEAIARLGFDRVLVSRIAHGVWMPESMFVRTDAQWGEAILAAGQEEPTVLESVVESDVVGSGERFVVDEVQTHPRVHQSIARVSRSDSYGVVPLTVGAMVVGMVHADCYFQQRRVHREECDALAVVAEVLAAQLSRLLLLDRLSTVQEDAGRLWADSVPTSRHHSQAWDGLTTLTHRELDVLELMAEGETNFGIGRRLGVSEGTVKTHVSHILRKLGASNRAQAVSCWGGR